MSGLRDELQSSSAVTAQLQSQLQESMRQREREVHSLTVERDNLHTKVRVHVLYTCMYIIMYIMYVHPIQYSEHALLHHKYVHVGFVGSKGK